MFGFVILEFEDQNIKAKMQNSPSKYNSFSFQYSKFGFWHFSPLNLIHFKLSPPLICY